MIKKLICLLLPALMAAGCVRENLDDCVGCRLYFRYTLNSEGVDLITAHVQDIHIYVFDQSTGMMVDVIEVGPTDIARGWVDIDDLPDGTYTFSAWGGSSADMSRSFAEAHMTDATVHDHSYPRIGHTSIDEFFMMLDYEAAPAELHGDITPKVEQFDDLFFAMAGNIPVSKGETRTIELDFIRNTNVLKITVTGLEHLWNHNLSTRKPAPDQPLHVFVVGRNGRHMWDNTIDPDARLVRYEPPCHTLTANTMGVDIKTMRLDISRHTSGDPVLLYVRNAVTGDDMIAPLDVVGTILQTRSTRGDLLYPDQEALDREYEFEFDLSILHDLSVKVTVNGWDVIDAKPDTDRP
jgi:hypothetical protein